MPTWRDQLEKAKKIAREKAPEVRARAEEAAQQARTIAETQSERGKAKLDAKLEQRRQAAETSKHWFEHEEGDTHTEGFPDDESMRASIQAAAEHGWTVLNIAEVPKRRLPGGLTSLVAREALDRVKQSPRFMVTFRRIPADGEPDQPPETPGE